MDPDHLAPCCQWKGLAFRHCFRGVGNAGAVDGNVDRTKGFHRTLNTGFHAGFLGDVDLLRDGSIAKAALQNLQALVIAIERSDADACLRQGQT